MPTAWAIATCSGMFQTIFATAPTAASCRKGETGRRNRKEKQEGETHEKIDNAQTMNEGKVEGEEQERKDEDEEGGRKGEG